MEKKGYNPYATPLNYETIVEISEIDPPLQRSQENFAREETDFSSSRKLRAPREEISVSLSRGSPPPVMPRSKQLLPTKFRQSFFHGKLQVNLLSRIPINLGWLPPFFSSTLKAKIGQRIERGKNRKERKEGKKESAKNPPHPRLCRRNFDRWVN